MTKTHVRWALAALALGAFAIGTGEFAIMGLLPEAATGLQVSIPHAGTLISAYALGVVVGAPLLIAAASKLPRRTALVILIGVYGGAHLLSAIAPDYGWMLVARFLAGLPHGAFFGIGAIVAGRLVDPSKQARAMAMMLSGLTVANILGVPASTLLGQIVGWRWVFGVVGLIALLAAAAVTLAVPVVRGVATPRLIEEIKALRRFPVWITLLVCIVGGAALFSVYSYIAPMLTDVAGYSPTAVTLILALFGIGMTVGNLVGARLADRGPVRAVVLFFGLDVVLALLLVPALQNRVTAAVVLFLFAVSVFGTIPGIQLRIINGAGEAPHMASGAMHMAFNAANAVGAWLGGLVIAAGFGYTAPAFVAAGLAFLGGAIALFAGWRERRASSRIGDDPLVSAG
jgi:DHA1 family inner membrane transport protein